MEELFDIAPFTNSVPLSAAREAWKNKDPAPGMPIGGCDFYWYYQTPLVFDHRYFGPKSVRGDDRYRQPRPEFMRGFCERAIEQYRTDIGVALFDPSSGLSVEDWMATFDACLRNDSRAIEDYVKRATMKWTRSPQGVLYIPYDKGLERHWAEFAQMRASKLENLGHRQLADFSLWTRGTGFLNAEDFKTLEGFDYYVYLHTTQDMTWQEQKWHSENMPHGGRGKRFFQFKFGINKIGRIDGRKKDYDAITGQIVETTRKRVVGMFCTKARALAFENVMKARVRKDARFKPDVKKNQTEGFTVVKGTFDDAIALARWAMDECDIMPKSAQEIREMLREAASEGM